MSKSKKNIPTKSELPIPKAQKAQIVASVAQPKTIGLFFKSNIFPLVILSILAFTLYISTVGFDYALDDTMVITGNKFTQRGIGSIGDIFRYESFRGYFGEQKQLLEGDRYRPLSIATFAVETSLFGSGNKAASHFINVLLYVLTAIMMYRVLLFIFPNKHTLSQNSDTEGDKKGISQLLTIPFVATALFIAHPLHVEVVANIKGRDEILCMLGELGTLYFTFRFIADNQTKYLIGSFAAFLIGIFSKESAITFLAVVPLTAHFFTNASTSGKLKVTLPIMAGILLYLLMRINAIGYLIDSKEVTDLMNNPFYGMSLGDRLATIFYTLLIYLKLHIFPHPLTHDYYPFQIPKMSWTEWPSILSLILHLGLIVVILRGWKKRTVWAYSAAFYLLTLSIVSNIFVSVGTFMNERFVYHASLGFCIAVAYFLMNFLKKNRENTDISGENTEMQKGNIVGFAIATLLVIGFSIKTMVRIPDWRNGTTLNVSAIKNSPNSARSNCFYAISIWENQFLNLPKEATNEQRLAVLNEMKPYFERSIQILPNYSSALKMWAGIGAEYHKIDKNLDTLIARYDQINRSGVYEPFTVQYLKYVNDKTTDPLERQKLKTFYMNTIDFFKKNNINPAQIGEYQKLLAQVQ